MATIFELEEAAASAQADVYNAQVSGDPNAIAQAQASLTSAQASLASVYNGATVSPAQALALQAAVGSAATLTPDGSGGYSVTAAALPPPPAPPAPTVQPVTLPASTPPAPTPPATSSATSTTLKPRVDAFGGAGDAYCAAYPDDPYCSLFMDLGGFAGAIGGPTYVENTIVIQETGLLAADVQQLIDNGLGGLWGAVVTGVDDVVAAVVKAIQVAVTELGNAVKAAYAWLSRLAGMILTLLKTILEDVLNAIVQAVQDIEQAVKDLYNDVLKPIAQVLQNIRDKILDLWKRFIVPMLIILQDIRRVLTILSLFHVKFAQKLDNAIGDLERRITAPLFYLLGYVNAVSNWINLIVAANYLLQKPTFLNSLNAYLGESINLQLNGMNKPIDPATLAAAQASAVYPTPAQSVADFQQFISTGTGAFQPVITNATAVFEQYSQGNYS